MSNKVMDAKKFAVSWWDNRASTAARQGKNFSAFGNWMGKQLAKAGPQSWPGLAVDVVGLGSGALALRGARALPFLKGGGRVATAISESLPIVRRVGQATGKAIRAIKFHVKHTPPPGAGSTKTIRLVPQPKVIQGVAQPGGGVYYPQTRQWQSPPITIRGKIHTGHKPKPHVKIRTPAAAFHERMKLRHTRLGSSLASHRPFRPHLTTPALSASNRLGIRPSPHSSMHRNTHLRLHAPRLGSSLGAAMRHRR